ncbi:MAG: YbjN domain-containing protein [Rhodothermales bacterium]
MRTSSKVLVFVFFVVAAGLIYVVNKADEDEISAAVEARLEEAVAEQERALADTLAAREQAVQARLAALDSAIARVSEPAYFRLSADVIARVLERMGMDYERGVDNQGDPKFTFRLATYRVTMYFYGCEEEGCTSLQLFASFTLNDPPTTDLMNEWNKSKRYGTAYINDSGNACLDNDLIIKGGITLGAVEAFIVNFRNRLNEYTRHIGF